MTQNIIIRHECESDYRIVENLTREAFWDWNFKKDIWAELKLLTTLQRAIL